MGKYTRKCSSNSSGAGEVAVMEVAQSGVRTRGRAMAPAAEGAADNSGSVKRRKVDIDNGELRLTSSKSVRGDVIATLKNYDDSGEEDLRDPCGDGTSISSGDVQASCCSSNGSITEKPKSADLEEGTEIETAMIRYKSNGRESTPTSELKEESGELESSNTATPSVIIESPAGKTPPAAELEEFFAAAEEDLHKRFKDKYNYDIVKDVPLKGRFEWVQLNP